MKSIMCYSAILVAALWSPILSHQQSEKSPELLKVAEIIRAKRFELVDDKNRVRIQLAMDQGHPVIELKDENGKRRVSVFQKSDATGIYISDSAEDTRIGIAQFPHGGGIALHGEKGKGAAVYVLMNDEARLDVYDQEGKLTNRWPGKREKE